MFTMLCDDPEIATYEIAYPWIGVRLATDPTPPEELTIKTWQVDDGDGKFVVMAANSNEAALKYAEEFGKGKPARLLAICPVEVANG